MITIAGYFNVIFPFLLEYQKTGVSVTLQKHLYYFI